MWLALLLVPRGTCIGLCFFSRCRCVFRDAVFHVEQASGGAVFVCARAHVYYGVVFRLLNMGGVVWLGVLCKRLLLCGLTSTGACAKDYWSRWRPLLVGAWRSSTFVCVLRRWVVAYSVCRCGVFGWCDLFAGVLVLLQNNLTFTAVKKNSEMRYRDCAFRRLSAELTGTRKQCPLRRHCL